VCAKYRAPVIVAATVAAVTTLLSDNQKVVVLSGYGTFRYEFYALRPHFKDTHNLNLKLAEFSRFYREKRPRQRLNYLTPMEYFTYRGVKSDSFWSHMY
jgi:transposase InsO family protein